MSQIDPERKRVADFIRKYGLKIVPIDEEKHPIGGAWQTSEVYEPLQKERLKAFEDGAIKVGLICGVKCGNGYYLSVVDVDNKKVWSTVQEFESKTTCVKSGGEWQKGDAKGISKDVSRHLYFFTLSPIKTYRKHEEGIQVEIDILGKGAQVCAPTFTHPKTGRKSVFLNNLEPLVWKGDLRFDILTMLQERLKIKLNYAAETVNITDLLTGSIHEGNRDNAAIKVATWFRTKHPDDKDEVTKLMLEWNKDACQPPLDENVIYDKVNSAFAPEKPYGWKFIEKEIYTQEEDTKAEQLLDNPHEIPHFIYEANAEIVHEDKNKTIIPLLVFGKQSLEVSGKSAAGKNALLDACLKCHSATLKDEFVRKVTGLTRRSLRYLKNPPKVLYIAERRGFESEKDESGAEYDVKVGISEHGITTLFTNKQTMETEEVFIPIECFVFSTTEFSATWELANRIFNLIVDDSIEQNVAVIRFKLDQMAMAKNEKINTEPQKKILRCMFKKLRELNLKNEDFIVPWSRALEPLLPPSETSIRRHVDKMSELIYTFAKLYYRKLVKDKHGSYIIPPELLWQMLNVADEAIFTQILGMTRSQMYFWNMLLDLFKAQEYISIKDVASKTHRASGYIRKVFDFFEEQGLIITRQEGRERVAEVTPGVGDSRINKLLGLKYSELEKQYALWCRTHFPELLKKNTGRVTVSDFKTGTVFEKTLLANYTFEPKINLVIKEQQTKARSPKVLELTKSDNITQQDLEAFKDASES